MTLASRLVRMFPLALVGVHPSAALAYYPCNGPGPDEVMIGIDNSAGYDVPLCEYVGPPDGEPAYDDGYSDPGGYWVDQYATVAWATDGNGGPTYTWYINAASQSEADNGALAQCQASGFRDCRIATGVVNGAIAITVDSVGSLHVDWGTDARQAKKKSLKACKSQGGKGCKVEQVLESPAAWVNN